MSALTILHPIEAWRYWYIYQLPQLKNNIGLAPHPFFLKSIASDYVWFPKKAMKALCGGQGNCREKPLLSIRKDSDIPSFYGQCGIRGFKSKEMALDFGDWWVQGAVLGKVVLWGKIIEHEEGYRAEWAYPLSLEFGVCWRCEKLFPLSQTWLLREIINWWLRSIIICCNSCLDSTISYSSRFHFFVDNSIIISPPGWHQLIA